MKKFILKTKQGEKISQLEANNLNEAENFFAKRKGLITGALLKIYDVEQEIK